MKKTILLLLAAAACTLCSCDSQDDVAPQTGDPLELTLDEIDKSHKILTKAYGLLKESLHQEAILTIRKSGGDPDYFMKMMYEKTNEAFKQAVLATHGQAAVDVFLKIPDIEGEAFEKNIELLLLANSTENYADVTLKRLKQKSADMERWDIMKKIVVEGRAQVMPIEEISLNYSKLKQAIEVSDILLDLSLTEQQREEALKDFFLLNNTPPVFIALLLPAVQKVREAANAPKAEEMYLDWLETEIIPTVQGALDRDIIRRKAFFEYAGALNLIIGQNYNNEDQLSASIAILKARYDWKLLSLWADYYNLELAGE